MQKRGLFQQLVPMTGSFSEGFFSFGGLVQVMSLHMFPFLMTILKNAILNITASLEESGAVFACGKFCTPSDGQFRHRRSAGLC